MIKLLIFDFDGTLAKSKQIYFDAICLSLKKHGYNTSKKEVREVLGFRLEVLFNKLGITDIGEMAMLKREINGIVLKKAPRLTACPDAESIRNVLKDKKGVLVTNSLSEYTQPFLKKHKINFILVMGAEQFKSKQEAFKMLFRKFNVRPEEAVYIADRAQDVDVARDAGCKSVIISNRCSWSPITEIKKKKPDYLLRSLREIKSLF